MLTTANIELYDGLQKKVMLYHVSEVHPTDVELNLKHKLSQAKAELDESGIENWWHSENVGAMIVRLSAGEDEWHEKLPAFQPCLDWQEGSAYLWRVFLKPEFGEYEMHCFRLRWDSWKGEIRRMEKVYWDEEGENVIV